MSKVAYTDFHNDQWANFKKHLHQIIKKANEAEDKSIERGLTDLLNRMHGFEATESWRYDGRQ